jgi:hypothetical protein
MIYLGMKKKIVLTGANGIIAQRMLPGLTEQFDVTLLDIRDTDSNGTPVPGILTCDLLKDERSPYREIFRGHDAVVHSAFLRSTPAGVPGSPSGTDDFQTELQNVKMAYNVMQACVEAGIPRLVVMSSNHAADWYEPLILKGEAFGVTPEMPPYSDNYYGWSKISYESLGFLFAAGRENGGKVLENIQLRIGAPRETDIEQVAPGDITGMRRALGAYLSARDGVQLVAKSITTPDIRNQDGVPFQIFYGISGNSNRFWDISNARRVIGYKPQDDSLLLFKDQIGRIVGPDPSPD